MQPGRRGGAGAAGGRQSGQRAVCVCVCARVSERERERERERPGIRQPRGPDSPGDMPPEADLPWGWDSREKRPEQKRKEVK